MMTSANYLKIAHLVKLWADKIAQITTMNDIYDARRDDVVEDMRAFSNGIVAVVNVFAPLLNAETPAEFEEAAISPVNKGLSRDPMTITDDAVDFFAAGMYVGWAHFSEEFRDDCRHTVRMLLEATARQFGWIAG